MTWFSSRSSPLARSIVDDRSSIFHSQGRACRVHYTTFDRRSRLNGHDKRAPPIFHSEGPACRVRCTTLDHPLPYCGRDERVPPTLAGTCLSGPVHHVGIPILVRWAQQACPSELLGHLDYKFDSGKDSNPKSRSACSYSIPSIVNLTRDV